MTARTLLITRALTVGHGKHALLPPIDLELRAGELWGVVGRNGAGKTTLLRTLLGLGSPIGGTVERPSGVTIAYVPQRHRVDPLVPARAVDLIVEGAERRWSFLSPILGKQRRVQVERAIDATGARPFLGRRYRDLSEGQKQRVLLARALAGAPDLLVLDEPTSAMDMVAEREIIDILEHLRAQQALGILLVSHHLGQLVSVADRLLFVDSDEKVAVKGTPSEMVSHPTFADRYGAVLAPHGANTPAGGAA